ncbi:hypothetical protein [Aquimarina sp. AU474]|uniref:hypothetical protein n=1 Tax=Aquimarina sp. AU474 TaxID=2108529 RepID=UPI0013574BF5|nr:hypothetical protein [Aquimarina sp. AU474]
MLRNLFLGIILFSIGSINAQKSIHDYKYVIVPKSYEFLKGNDAYQLNSLTKFLFNKYGFRAVMQGENLPEDLAANGCMGLQADVKKDSGLFITRLFVSLTDCNGNEVFISEKGQSKEKEYKLAYHEALRNAFKSIEGLKYKYNEKQLNTEPSIEKTSVASQKEIAEPSKKVVTTKGNEQVSSSGSSTTTGSATSISYTLNSNRYTFKKTVYGFEVFQKKSNQDTSLGKIYKMERDNNYLVTAGDLSGGGHFDGYGNFVLERVNPATNKLIKDVLARQ